MADSTWWRTQALLVFPVGGGGAGLGGSGLALLAEPAVPGQLRPDPLGHIEPPEDDLGQAGLQAGVGVQWPPGHNRVEEVPTASITCMTNKLKIVIISDHITGAIVGNCDNSEPKCLVVVVQWEWVMDSWSACKETPVNNSLC